ncbi:9013_t:CDS:1, partial [Racocetra persica]
SNETRCKFNENENQTSSLTIGTWGSAITFNFPSSTSITGSGNLYTFMVITRFVNNHVVQYEQTHCK